MTRTTRAVLVTGSVTSGVVLFLASTVSPFRYEPLESAVLTWLLVLAGLFDRASRPSVPAAAADHV